MQDSDKIPKTVPENGFYYHYKHDPAGPINNYAYELIGVGLHTEDDCRPEDRNLAVYKPLYEAFVYKNGKMLDIRPLGMYMDKEIKRDNGEIILKPRFTRITDTEIISELKKIRKQMYPPEE